MTTPRKPMNKLWISITVTILSLVFISGCSPTTKTNNLPPLCHIIGGILENSTTVDAAVFSSTISCLVEGDLEGYAAGVMQLDSLVDKRDMVDVVVKGRRFFRFYLYSYIYTVMPLT